MQTIVSVEVIDEAQEVVSLELAKQQLRVESSFTVEDTLIQSMIDAAVLASENYIGGQLKEATAIVAYDRVSGAFLPVPANLFPVQSIEFIKYFDTTNTEQTLDASNYSLMKSDEKEAFIYFKNEVPELYDRPDAMKIEVKVGYAENIPAPIKQAILLQISDMYDRREDRMEVPLTAATKLMRPYKKF